VIRLSVICDKCSKEYETKSFKKGFQIPEFYSIDGLDLCYRCRIEYARLKNEMMLKFEKIKVNVF
jgi:hypothetical protein